MSTFCRNLIFLPKDLADKYASSKLQRRLQKYYGDAVVIQTKKGQWKSKIIFSGSITIAEAIQAARQMQSELNLLELKNDILICKRMMNKFCTKLHQYFVVIFKYSICTIIL